VRLHAPLVRINGEYTEVWVPCEHGDHLRDQVHAVITFRQSGEWWDVRLHDDLIRHHPEGIHAALGVAMMALGACARYDGSVSDD
jgi:hypothetical protein